MKWICCLALSLGCSSSLPLGSDQRVGLPTTDHWWQDGARACNGLSHGSDLRARYPSPDGQFEVLLCGLSGGIWAAPGQGSDGPGLVALIDTHTGWVIRNGRFEMIQRMEVPVWDTRVRSALFDWVLPFPLNASGAPMQSAAAIDYQDGQILQVQGMDGRFSSDVGEGTR